MIRRTVLQLILRPVRIFSRNTLDYDSPFKINSTKGLSLEEELFYSKGYDYREISIVAIVDDELVFENNMNLVEFQPVYNIQSRLEKIFGDIVNLRITVDNIASLKEASKIESGSFPVGLTVSFRTPSTNEEHVVKFNGIPMSMSQGKLNAEKINSIVSVFSKI